MIITVFNNGTNELLASIEIDDESNLATVAAPDDISVKIDEDEGRPNLKLIK